MDFNKAVDLLLAAILEQRDSPFFSPPSGRPSFITRTSISMFITWTYSCSISCCEKTKPAKNNNIVKHETT